MLKVVRCLITVCSGLLLGQAHTATSLSISPIDPIIESTQQATAVWLQNQSDAPVVMQIRVLGWRQINFEDDYQEAQQDLIASPPMATIPPGKRQLIRLVRGQAVPAGQEQAFRLLIDEIPPVGADASTQASKVSAGLQLQMRYSVPVFVAGDGIRLREDSERKLMATSPKLAATLTTVAGKKYLQIANSGPIHARLVGAVWQQGVKRVPITTGGLTYVLSGAQMRWHVPVAVTTGGVLKAKINGADVEIPVSS